MLADAIAAYLCAIDPNTPTCVKVVLLGAIVYFIVPTGLVPDFLAGIGYGDDASVLFAAISTVRGHIKPAHRERAAAALARLSESL